MTIGSTVASSATLTRMARAEDREGEEWISPIGQSIDDVIAEEEERDPEFKRENERNRPRRELARMLMVRRTELDLSQQELERKARD